LKRVTKDKGRNIWPALDFYLKRDVGLIDSRIPVIQFPAVSWGEATLEITVLYYSETGEIILPHP